MAAIKIRNKFGVYQYTMADDSWIKQVNQVGRVGTEDIMQICDPDQPCGLELKRMYVFDSEYTPPPLATAAKETTQKPAKKSGKK